ncbi:hypothetical protein BJ742DRAFT_818336 [Cladochytrium replicatum]|nr:hypothetical protein BJ742DRAFT_818336 [Cladochytrium replicatum]
MRIFFLFAVGRSKKGSGNWSGKQTRNAILGLRSAKHFVFSIVLVAVLQCGRFLICVFSLFFGGLTFFFLLCGPHFCNFYFLYPTCSHSLLPHMHTILLKRNIYTFCCAVCFFSFLRC